MGYSNTRMCWVMEKLLKDGKKSKRRCGVTWGGGLTNVTLTPQHHGQLSHVYVCVRERQTDREKKRGRERSQKLNKVRARREFNLPSPSIIRLPLPSQGIRQTEVTQPSQKLNLASETSSPGPQLPVGSACLGLPG